ncbi:hypothetical protein [Gimesia aquarii]|uniref:Uncharacterized protein n=1 Tax=Gimesia aquarii TaxID=2527964 RepID=A0A517X297_9PLAN|nr:hypothetical protein [Gimesia aquarii]QDU11633.1 hypothetical protein V202x_50570 [Gimesia aquarii]
MNELFEEQFRFNRDSVPNWEEGATHRKMLTGHLNDLAGENRGRLCVLGAGNCNDLNLKQLLHAFSEIHLVDIDGVALERAIQSQSLENEPSIFLHKSDLTGIGEQLAAWNEDDSNAGSNLTDIILKLSQPVNLNLPNPFDVVCSSCLLSQLIHLVVKAVGDTHPRFEETMIAIRSQHMQTMIDLMGEDGAGLLVSDFVSSASAPDLPHVPDHQFEQYLSQLLSSQNFFHGVHPGVLFSLLVGNSPFAQQVRNVEMLPPWRWNLGSRQYAVAAIQFYGLKKD